MSTVVRTDRQFDSIFFLHEQINYFYYFFFCIYFLLPVYEFRYGGAQHGDGIVRMFSTRITCTNENFECTGRRKYCITELKLRESHDYYTGRRGIADGFYTPTLHIAADRLSKPPGALCKAFRKQIFPHILAPR